MATTTPNFGWPVPTSTDLVKDGAVAIEGLGDAIDASLLDLKGGTTGQVLTKASGTDMDFSWTAVDPLVILDAKGDLITATAADTPARLAVGTNNQVLTADSTTATGLKWATPSAGGGMTLIQTITMTQGATSSASFTSIPSTYKHLFFTFDSWNPATNDVYLNGRMNNDTGSNYSVSTIYITAANTINTSGAGAFTSWMNPTNQYGAIIPGANSTGGNIQAHGFGSLWIYNYTDTAGINYQWKSHGYTNGYGALVEGSGVYLASAAISRVDFSSSSGNANCTIRLYGVS